MCKILACFNSVFILFKASENALTAANPSSDAQQLERDQIVKLKKVITHSLIYNSTFYL